MLNPDNWDILWFQEYRTENGLVNYISGDFNCDTKQDYALLLANANNELAVWVIQSNNDDYQFEKIHVLGQIHTPVSLGIELIPKGKLDYINLDVEESKTINLNCPGIQIAHFERAAVTYFWNNGKFESVQTAD